MSPDAYLEMADTESRHWWFCGRRNILNRMLGQLALPENARILEIGSGTGGNLPMLAQFGQVSAMEMDETARALATQKTGGLFDIRAGYCPDHIPFVDQRFDLICLFDVLEHIPNDVGTLATLKGLLAPGGRVMLTVPAHPWLWGAHDEYLHHQRRYQATELKQMLIRSGFQIKRFSYFNTLLFPLAALVRLKERFSKSQQATGGAVPPAPLNSLFKTLFGLERYALPHVNLPFGVSLLTVLEIADIAHAPGEYPASPQNSNSKAQSAPATHSN